MNNQEQTQIDKQEQNFLELLKSTNIENIRVALELAANQPNYKKHLVPYIKACQWAGIGYFSSIDQTAIHEVNTKDWLRFGHQDVSYIPPEIGLFVSLEVLDLTENNIIELPPELGQLSNLTELQLNYNQLTTLPEEIGQLKKLQNIALVGNNIKDLPIALGHCTNLQAIWLGNMKVSEQSTAKVQQMLPDCNIYITKAGKEDW